VAPFIVLVISVVAFWIAGQAEYWSRPTLQPTILRCFTHASDDLLRPFALGSSRYTLSMRSRAFRIRPVGTIRQICTVRFPVETLLGGSAYGCEARD
jgi:hypothetical protein